MGAQYRRTSHSIRHAVIIMVVGAAPPMLASGQSGVLEEIIVTAEKRAQDIQDVSAAVSSYTGDQYRQLGFDDITDISSTTPNLNFALPLGEGTNPALSIRGVGLNDFSDNNEGPVSMYVDEVYIGTLAGQAVRLYDLERIEVLRGPQGSLYGRNTTGGLVHFISKKPTDELDGYGQVSYGRYDDLKFEGAVGGALGENVRARASVMYNDSGDYQTDRTTGDGGGAREIVSARLQLAFDPSSESEVLLGIHGSAIENNAQFYQQRGLLEADLTTPCSVADVFAEICRDEIGYSDTDNDVDAGDYSGGGANPLEIDTFGATAKISWDISDTMELVSISGFETVEKFHRETAYSGPNVPLGAVYDVDADQFSQEVRISGDSEEVSWIAGLFYFDDDKSATFGIPLVSYQNAYDQDTESWAVFGHADWQMSDSWSLQLGLRYTDESKGMDDVANGSALGGTDAAASVSISTEAVSGKVGISWRPAEDWLVYAKASRGFKSGGFNGGFITDPVQLAPYEDETVNAFELGAKATLADGRARFAASAFYYDYEDFQAFTQANINGLPLSQLTNAGNAKVSGVEAELVVRPTEYFEALIAIGLLDTESEDFISFEGLDDLGQPIFTDLSGSSLVLAPEVNASTIARVFYPLANGEIGAQLDFSYSDKYFFDSDNSPTDVGGDFTIWGGRIWYGLENYEVALWMKNLSDERYVVEGFDILGGQSLIYSAPQSYGITVSAEF